MAFHFPLMPRLFMALKREEASPIVDIVSETQDLPADLPVGGVPPESRRVDAVGGDRRGARLPLQRVRGRSTHAPESWIRRRLAPLLDNERRRVDLAHALLLSLPASPVLYYGDEIGMGDNIQLGDRDGVRTPMQWSERRHMPGSRPDQRSRCCRLLRSRCTAHRVHNVEAQERDRSSLLNWIKRLTSVRRRHQAFSRGSIDFISCDNHRVLAFVREWKGQQVLVVTNLSASAQSVAIQSPHGGDEAEVIDLLADSTLPPITSPAYSMTLDPHACRWLELPTRRMATVQGRRDIAADR